MNVRGRQLASPIEVEGPGLFTEFHAKLRVLPNYLESAVVVGRDGHAVTASSAAIAGRDHAPQNRLQTRNTSLRLGEIGAAQTVEHLLAALAGLGVTAAIVDLDGPEVPIGDGSAKPFTDAIVAAGLIESREVEPITIEQAITVTSEDGLSRVVIEPADAPYYRYELDYGPNAPIKPSVAEWNGDAESFLAEIAPARTFCLSAEAEAMRALGMFKSFTPRDLLVIGDDGKPIDNDFRFPDEPTRHKLLDLIGDLALVGAGRPLFARVTAHRSGHRLHHLTARAIAATLR